MKTTDYAIQKQAFEGAIGKGILWLGKTLTSLIGHSAAKGAVEVASKTGMKAGVSAVEHAAAIAGEHAAEVAAKGLGGQFAFAVTAKAIQESAVNAAKAGTEKAIAAGASEEALAAAANMSATKAVDAAKAAAKGVELTEPELKAIQDAALQSAKAASGLSDEVFAKGMSLVGKNVGKKLSTDTAALMSKTFTESVNKVVSTNAYNLSKEETALLTKIPSSSTEIQNFLSEGLKKGFSGDNPKLNAARKLLYDTFKKDLASNLATHPIQSVILAPTGTAVTYGLLGLGLNQAAVTSYDLLTNGITSLFENSKTASGSINTVISRLKSIDEAGPAFESKKQLYIGTLSTAQKIIGNDFVINKNADSIIRNPSDTQLFSQHFDNVKKSIADITPILEEMTSSSFMEQYKEEVPESTKTMMSNVAVGDITKIGELQRAAKNCQEQLNKFSSNMASLEGNVSKSVVSLQSTTEQPKTATQEIINEFIKVATILDGINIKKKLNKTAYWQAVVEVIAAILPDLIGGIARLIDELSGNVKNLSATLSSLLKTLNISSTPKWQAVASNIVYKLDKNGLQILRVKEKACKQFVETYQQSPGDLQKLTQKYTPAEVAQKIQDIKSMIGAVSSINEGLENVLSGDFETVWDSEVASFFGAIGKWSDKWLNFVSEGGLSDYSAIMRYAKIAKDQANKLLVTLNNINTQLSVLAGKSIEIQNKIKENQDKKSPSENVDSLISEYSRNL